MKNKPFPENPFLMVFGKIAIIDGLVMLLAVGLAILYSDWLWYALGTGLLISIVVFTVLNQRCLKQLSCPHCKKDITFEKNVGFVCHQCKTCWEMN
ncbi:MAG: hypothetical protein R8K49_03030 [Mariprofundaceae bacterium]